MEKWILLFSPTIARTCMFFYYLAPFCIWNVLFTSDEMLDTNCTLAIRILSWLKATTTVPVLNFSVILLLFFSRLLSCKGKRYVFILLSTRISFHMISYFFFG